MRTRKYLKLDWKTRKKLVRLLKEGDWSVRNFMGASRSSKNWSHTIEEKKTHLRLSFHKELPELIAIDGGVFVSPWFSRIHMLMSMKAEEFDSIGRRDYLAEINTKLDAAKG